LWIEPIPTFPPPDNDEASMKKSPKGATEAARTTQAAQAHSWIGNDWRC
jgi:hypothetical protein